jgi:hypothetical protein
MLFAAIEALRSEGYTIELVEDGTRYYVIFTDFDLGEYVPARADLMVMADYQYPMSAMDMFWTYPHVTCKNGARPQNADHFETYCGRSWQRWSWHYGGWNPSRHNIKTHLQVVIDRLARGM